MGLVLVLTEQGVRMGNTDGVFQAGQVDPAIAADSDFTFGHAYSERVVAQLVDEDADLGADVILIVGGAVQDSQLVEVTDGVAHSKYLTFYDEECFSSHYRVCILRV